MKKNILFLFLYLFSFCGIAFAQEQGGPEFWMNGLIQIQLDPSVEKTLDQQPVQKNALGQVVFGFSALDSLNHKAGIRGFRQTFGRVLENSRYSQRHRAHGLHLWYDLYPEAGADLDLLVQAYGSLPGVVFAEAVLPPPQETAYQGEKILANPSIDIPDDTFFSNQWYLNNTGQAGGTPGADIRMLDAWELETGKPEVVVAVIARRINYWHQDLKDNLWVDTGYVFSYAPHWYLYNFERGTHTAGVILARPNNNTGVAGIAGGWGKNKGASLMSLHVLNEYGEAMAWAADRGASFCVVTESVLPSKSNLLGQDYFLAYGGGEVMKGGMIAGETENKNTGGFIAVTSTNNRDQRSYHAVYGPHIDVSAPGGESYPPQQGVLSTYGDNMYTYFPGFAAASVIGVGALVLSKYPMQFTGEELRDILKYSADDHYAVNPDFPLMLGHGRLNARAALELAPRIKNIPAKPENFRVIHQDFAEVQVQWDLNKAQDDVLLVFSTQASFGSPLPGKQYAEGDTLGGGGRVVFAGKGKDWTQRDLEPRGYYFFRIWSKDKNEVYSFPASLMAMTQTDVISQLPYVETFPVPVLPAGWSTTVYPETSRGWQVGVFPGGITGTGSSYAFSGTGVDRTIELISPLFNLENYSSVTLSFMQIISVYWSQDGQGEVMLSINGGGTWERIAQMHYYSQPPKTKINLDQAAGFPMVRLKWKFWETRSLGGYTFWSIDNITLSEEPALALSQSPHSIFRPLIYPNPAREQVFVELPAFQGRAKISLGDINGKLLDFRILNQAAENQKISIPLSAFPRGIYLLRIETGQEVVMKKLIVF